MAHLGSRCAFPHKQTSARMGALDHSANDVEGLRAGQRTDAVTAPGAREPVDDCMSGTRCMSMMSTHSPIAVSMVAGRVRRCGLGCRTLRWSAMPDTPQNNDFSKSHDRNRKCIWAPSRRGYARAPANTRKILQCQWLRNLLGNSTVTTIYRGSRSREPPPMVVADFARRRE